MSTIEEYLEKAKLYTPTGDPVVDAAKKRLLEFRKKLDDPITLNDAELAILVADAVEHGAKRKSMRTNFRPVEKLLSQEVEFSPKFHKEILPYFSEHFKKQDIQALEKLILKQAHIERPVRFDGSCNVLVEFFKRVKYNGLLTCPSYTPLVEWISHYFQYKDSGQYKKFSKGTVLEILKHTSKEGKAQNHILTDKVPSLLPEKRRKI